MQAFKKPSRHAVVIAGAAGLAVVGALGTGAAADADSGPAFSASSSSTGAAATQPTGAPSTTPQDGAPSGPAAGSSTLPAPPKHQPHIGGTLKSISGTTVTGMDMDGFPCPIDRGDSASVTKNRG